MPTFRGPLAKVKKIRKTIPSAGGRRRLPWCALESRRRSGGLLSSRDERGITIRAPPKRLLLLPPLRDYPLLNFFAVSALFLFVSWRVSIVTQRTRKWAFWCIGW